MITSPISDPIDDPSNPTVRSIDDSLVVRIRPSRGWISLNLRELWAYRELLFFLALRDIKIRYKQTVLGVAWVILQPLLTMLLFTLFFGRLAKIESDGLPYSVFCFAALVPWTFFAHGLTQASNSLVGNAQMITKVYFPRLTIPVASIASGLIDLVPNLIVLWVLLWWHDRALTIQALWLPLFLALTIVTTLGVGLWLSALNVQYRDVRYAIPFLTQLWMFATPIAYPSSLVPEAWRPVYGLNPLSGAVEGVRWSLLGKGTGPGLGSMLIVSGVTALVLFVTGAFAFRRMERTFADVV